MVTHLRQCGIQRRVVVVGHRQSERGKGVFMGNAASYVLQNSKAALQEAVLVCFTRHPLRSSWQKGTRLRSLADTCEMGLRGSISDVLPHYATACMNLVRNYCSPSPPFISYTCSTTLLRYLSQVISFFKME